MAGAQIAAREGLDTVALSGGVFQNHTFRHVLETTLVEAGLSVLGHELVPTNDGGISIGQAAVAAWSAR
jgi:hydrogenase maturation protein HypF